MDNFLRGIAAVCDYLWYLPMPVFLVGTHLYFTGKLRFPQRKLPAAIRLSARGRGGYQALATSLAATIGTGNIIGIATAVAVGGAGAVFWCWLTGLAGVATCYAECDLAMRYAKRDREGRLWAGPMYVLEQGLGKKGLAVFFALSAVLTSLGMGCSAQSYSIRLAAGTLGQIPPYAVGIAVAALTGMILIGGKKGVARVCIWLVPLMSLFYLGGCLWILVIHAAVIPDAVYAILSAALTGRAFAGGVAGGGILLAMRIGIARGLFTNEAGLGSIPMSVSVREPGQNGERLTAETDQAMISMTGPFWDTVVMCALTGIAIVCAMLAEPEAYAGLAPEQYCFQAFRELPMLGEELLAVALILFAFATILGWNVYGMTAVQYLFGERGRKIYLPACLLAVGCGAFLTMDLVWQLSDLFNALMALPNLFALWALRRQVRLLSDPEHL